MTQAWELVNPEGVAITDPMASASGISTLEGKTVLLRWNGKPNGDIFLNRLAELLSENVKDIKIIKAYEIAPETSVVSHGSERSAGIATKLLTFQPDIVIASQGD